MSTRKLWMAGSALMLFMLAVLLLPLEPEREPAPAEPEPEPAAEPAAAETTAPAAAPQIDPQAQVEVQAAAEPSAPTAQNAPEPKAADEPSASEPARVGPRKHSLDGLRLHFVGPANTAVPGIGLSHAACAQLLERQSRGEQLDQHDLLRLRLECRRH